LKQFLFQNENENLIEIDNDRMTDVNAQLTDEPKDEALEDEFDESRLIEETENAFENDLKTPDTILLENEVELEDFDEPRVINEDQELEVGTKEGKEETKELAEVMALDDEQDGGKKGVNDEHELHDEKQEIKSEKLEVEQDKQEDETLEEDEVSDPEESTVINNDNYDQNNDSAYETIEMNSQNSSNSRLQSADTNDNDIDNETGENFILKAQDVPQNIEIINDEMGKTEMEDLTIDRFVNDAVNSPSPVEDDNRDVVISAENPTESGYGLLHNSRNKLAVNDEV
jgi:hypothetical protein